MQAVQAEPTSPADESPGNLDWRSDQYGLGATLFALLTGHPPFQSQELPELVKQIRNATPQLPIDVTPIFRFDDALGMPKQHPYSPPAETPDSPEREELVAANRVDSIFKWCMRSSVALINSVVASMAATAIGLAVVLIVGMTWWPTGSGPWGVLLGVVSAAWGAQLIRQRTSWPASSIAAGIGAAVACFLAIALGEGVEPGSLRWGFMGGIYGGRIGLPVSAILGPIGLLEAIVFRRARTSIPGDQK